MNGGTDENQRCTQNQTHEQRVERVVPQVREEFPAEERLSPDAGQSLERNENRAQEQ